MPSAEDLRMAQQAAALIDLLDRSVFPSNKGKVYVLTEEEPPDENVELRSSGSGQAMYILWASGISRYFAELMEGRSGIAWEAYVWSYAAQFVRRRFQIDGIPTLLRPTDVRMFPELVDMSRDVEETLKATSPHDFDQRYDAVIVEILTANEVMDGRDTLEHLADLVRVSPTTLAHFAAP
ncbi:hypothetical protein KW782_00195 [Candidatus Parcubacteria bacterium]|nr:hypothetical protein [Candidatus Parcubacteria bacterium]